MFITYETFYGRPTCIVWPLAVFLEFSEDHVEDTAVGSVKSGDCHVLVCYSIILFFVIVLFFLFSKDHVGDVRMVSSGD